MLASKSQQASLFNYHSPIEIMFISPTPSSNERSPLLSNWTSNCHDPRLVDALSSASLSAEVDFPQREGVNQGRGVLDFRLFVTLFYESVPGKFICTVQLLNSYQTKPNSPVILSYILQNSIQTVSIAVAGRLGPHELSVAAFSLMLAFVTG